MAWSCGWKLAKCQFLEIFQGVIKQIHSITLIAIFSKLAGLNFSSEVQCLPQCGLFSPFVRTARFWVTEWGNQILTNMNFVGIDMLYKLQKRKFAKGHFKGQKRSLDCFYNQSMPTWSISPWKMKNEKVHESILECRYGSQLQTPLKKFACFYWIYGMRMAFVPKTRVSEWP